MGLALERQTTACPKALRTRATPAATVFVAPSGTTWGFTSTCDEGGGKKAVSVEKRENQLKGLWRNAYQIHGDQIAGVMHALTEVLSLFQGQSALHGGACAGSLFRIDSINVV